MIGRMKRSFDAVPCVMIAVAALTVGLGAAQADTIYLEAERFATIRGEVRNFHGVQGVILTAPKPEMPELSTRFKIPKTTEAELWLRVYFPWAGQDQLLVLVDDLGERRVTAGGDGKRWDQGNHQVWHWVRAGTYRLGKGEHHLKILPSGGRGQRVDAVALHDGEAAWGQAWLTGQLSRLYACQPRFQLSAGRPLLVEAEEFDRIEGPVESFSPGFKAAVLSEDRHRIALVLEARKATEAEIWARLFFDGKGMFEGLTMEEGAKVLFITIDGEAQKTILVQDGRRWHWVHAGSRELKRGKHLLVMQKQGTPVKVDKVLFHTGGDESVTHWTRAHYPHALPFGIPNEVAFDAARRVSDQRVFGSLADDAKLEWLGREKDGATSPVQVSLPGKAGLLFLEKVPFRPSSAPGSRRNPPQQVSVKVFGDGSGAALKVIYTDRNGERFLADLSPGVDWRGWRVVSHSIPLVTGSSTGVFYDSTGYLGDGPLVPKLAETTAAAVRITTQSEGGDGIPDPPFQIHALLIENARGRKTNIVVGEPYFESPFDIRADCRPVANGEVALKVTVTNRADGERTALVYTRTADPEHDLLKERSRLQALLPREVAVPAGGQSSLALSTHVEPGVHRLIYRVGQSPEKELLFASDTPHEGRREALVANLEERHGAFHLTDEDGPLLDASGRPIAREDTPKQYGVSFKVRVEGMDVTSLEYARSRDWAHPLKPAGYDLSDAAGWPRIPVPYGVLAIDPSLGRAKFSEGRRGRMAVADVAYGGFGAPGHGELLVKGNYVVVPPGEANFTVVDVSDKENPKVASFVTSWYFSGRMDSYKRYGLYESSRRGLKLVDDLWSNPYRPGTTRSVNLDRAKYGRVSRVFEEHDLAVTDSGTALWLHDLTDVFNPAPIGKVEGATGLIPSGERGIFFTTVGETVKALDMSHPRKPRLLDGEIRLEKGEPAKTAAKGKKAAPEVAALSAAGEGHLAFRLGNAFLVYSCSVRKKLTGRKLCALAFPEGSKKHVFVAFHNGHFYLLDGQYGPGAYSVPYNGWKSRIFTYRLGGPEPELVDTYEDPKPTVYSQIAFEGDYAYVNDYNYGLWIFDLRDPAHPRKLSGVATAEEGDGVWLNGRTAYFWQTFGGNVYAIDITAPDRMKHLGNYWDGGWVSCTNYYRGNYVIGGKDDFVYIPRTRYGMLVVDARDSGAMKEVGVFRDPEGKPVIGRGAQIHVEGDRAYLVVDGQPAKVHVFDVSHPAKPECLSVAEAPVGSTLFAKGDRLYLAGKTTFTIMDVRDGKAPKSLSSLDLSQQTDRAKVIRGIAVRGHCAYLTDNFGTARSLLHLIDVRDGARPQWLKSIDPMPELMDAPCSSSWSGLYQDLVVEGDYLFIGHYGQIECYDVSDPESPVYFDRIAVGYQWSVGLRWGEHLFLPGLAGLFAIDVPCSSQIPTGKVTLK